MYFPQDPSHIKKEKKRAQELKKSQWWKNKLAQGICHYCEQKHQPDELTMEHLIPVGRGGHSDKANVVAACKACNTKKGAMLDTDFIKNKD